MNCVSDDDINWAGQRPGNNPTGSNFTRANKRFTEQARDNVGYTRDVEDPTIKENLSSAIDEDSASIENPTQGDTVMMGKLAKKMLLDRAKQFYADMLERRDELISAYSASSSSPASAFANLAAGLSSRFLHGMGDLFKYSSSFFGTEGKSANDNPFWRAVQRVLPVTQTQLSVFNNWIKDWQKTLVPLARRAGMDVAEFMQAIGDLAVFEHTPERNAQLLKQWRNQLTDIEAKRAEGLRLSDDETRLLEQLPKQIEDLENNLDAAYAVLDDDGKRIVKSGGYLNGEAQRKWNELTAKLGLTEEEARAATAGLRDIYMRMRDRAIEAGVIRPDQIAEWPEYELYVPVKTEYDATSGPTGDAHIFDPGKFHHTDGMYETPVDAFTSITKYGHKIANAIGQQELGDAMLALWVRQSEMKLTNPDFDAGIRTTNYAKLLSAKYGKDPAARAWAEHIYDSADGGGIVVEVPVRAEDGSVIMERRLLYFDPTWTDTTNNTGVTGALLNQALTTASRFGAMPTHPFFRGMAKATSALAQTLTRFNVLFAPYNMNRDGLERLTHLGGREYTLENGTVIDGMSLIPSYMVNVASAAKILGQELTRTLPDGPARTIINEYRRNGLSYQPTQGLMQKKIELSPSNPKFAGLMQRAVDSNLVNFIVSKFDGYNDFFNNIAPLAQYMTLREAGLSERAASSATLEMMNLYQSGSWTAGMQAAFPFVRPTMQAAGAMARTFGFAPNARGEWAGINMKGWATFTAMVLGHAMLLPMIKAGLGETEDGQSLYDLIPLDDLTRFIPFGIDSEGRYIKLPTGFGPMQVAIAFTTGMDRWMNGNMSGEDVAFNMIKSVFRNVTPNDWPSYSASQDPIKWLMQAFSPMIVRPIIDVGVNKNFAGNAITYGANDPAVSSAVGGNMATPEIWKTLAKNILEYGHMDVAPESLRALFEGYAKGPLRLFTSLMNEDNLNAAGLDKTAREELGPALTALGATIGYGKVANPERIMFYDILNRLNNEVRMSGVKITDESYGNDPVKRREYQTGILRGIGWDDSKIEKFLTLRDASRKLQSISREFGSKYRADSSWLDEDDDAIYDMFDTYNNKKLTEMYNALVAIGALDGASLEDLL